MPTFNRAYVLERAITSVLAQSYKQWELFIVDDGSSDGTRALVASISDQRIHYIYQENQGVSGARNTGLGLARSAFICFLDSDDEWLPDKLHKQLDYLQANPEYLWVHSEEIWVRNGVRVNAMKKHQKGGGDQFLNSLSLCLIGASTIMIKKELLTKIGLFSTEHMICEDYDLWLRALRDHEIGYIEKPLIIKYGGGSDQLSTQYVGMDYYRIKTLVKLWRDKSLSKERLQAIHKIATAKCEILLKGYIKHQNYTHYDEVTSWQKELFSFVGHLL